MKLDQSFEVAAPIDGSGRPSTTSSAWRPASRRGDHRHDDDGTYHGTFQVKLGPTTASYRGTIKIESADEATHTATLGARDRQARPGRRVGDDRQHARGERRRDAVSTPPPTSRSPAGWPRFGRGGMIQDISNRLLRDFSTCLQARLAEVPNAPTGEEVTRGEAAA